MDVTNKKVKLHQEKKNLVQTIEKVSCEGDEVLE